MRSDFRRACFWCCCGAVFVAAVAVRIAGLGWGLPFIHHPDEPLNLEIVHDMMSKGLGHYREYFYPPFFFYMHIPGQLMLKVLSGRLQPIVMQSMGNGYATQPEAFIVGRALTVGFGVGIVAANMALARSIGMTGTGAIFVGLLTAVNPLLVEHSQVISPDIPAAFFSTLALIGVTRILGARASSGYIFAGLMTGLAASSKYTAGLVGLAVPAAHVLRQRYAFERIDLLLVSATLAVAVFIVLSPFVVLDFEHARDGILEVFHIYASGHPGAEGDAWKFNLLWVWQSVGPMLAFALFVPGYSAKPKLISLGFFIVAYFLMISVQVVRFERNLVPMIPALLTLIGAGFETFARVVHRRINGQAALVLVTVLAGASVVPCVIRTVSDIERRSRDERAEARAWIDQNVRPQASVLVDSYSPYVAPSRFDVKAAKFVLSQPTATIVSNDFVVIAKTGSGRFLADRAGPQRRRFDEIGAAACERREFKDSDGSIRFWLFRFNC